MERLTTSTLTGANTDLPSISGTHLHGRWLIFAKILWSAIFMLTLVVFCANLAVGSYGLVATILFVAVTGAYFAVSLVLFWPRSTERFILLISLNLFLVGGVIILPYPNALAQWNWVWLFPILFLQFLAWSAFSVMYMFPDGRFIPGFTRWLALGWIAFWLVANLPVPIPDAFYPWNWWASPPMTVVQVAYFCSLTLALLYRYRRVSTPVQRQQIKWVVFATTVCFLEASVAYPVLFILPSYYPALGSSSLLFQLVALITTALSVLVPLSIGFALLRYRLWDIDIIINRTLVYGVLTISIVALYILVVVGLGTLLQAQGNLGIALLATGLVAVLFQPVRNRLQRAVNHLMYGERDDPYRVLTRLGSRLEATLAPEAVLPTIVETVAQALKLPYAAITLKQGDALAIAASYGSSKDDPVRLPLVYQSEQVGELVLAPRAPGESFTPADRTLLDDLARQAGIAAHAVRLTADLKRLTVDLQHSRERLVTTREEERRRLRRDLHDGLGPQLASLTLKLETARNRLAHDPQADALLSDLALRTQATVADIRRLVYALRPPALDELGLLSALRELTLQSSDQIAMRFEAPDCLPELPAAVEVAVYRIAQEALTNVVRHAQAHHCDIRLALHETTGLLALCIQDDGCGLLPSRPVGVGLTSMRERAEELGGTCTIEQIPTGGTRFLARLPYTRTEAADPRVVTPSILPKEE